MMDVLCCKITIGDANPSNPMEIKNAIEITEVQSIEINETYKKLIGTAKITVWRNHAPFLSALKSGALSYTIEGQTHEIALRNGFVEISNNTILVCIENQEPK